MGDYEVTTSEKEVKPTRCRRVRRELVLDPLGAPKQAKRRIETDLLFLARDILGYNLIQAPPNYVHQRMIMLDRRPERHHMGLFPRGTYKTTILTISKAIQLLCQNPNNTVTIANATGKQARKMLKEVQMHLRYNETLIGLYGPFYKRGAWRQDWCDIKQRQYVAGVKEPSIDTCGADTGITGSHPLYLLMDDLVCRDNITTSDQKLKVIDFVNKALPLAGPEGHIYLVGTRWAFDDMYQYLIDKWLPQRSADGTPLFAYDCMGVVDEHDVPIMPDKYPLSVIEELKNTMPMLDFAALMMNNPSAGGNTMIDPADVLVYQTMKMQPDEDYEVYVTVDPAISLDPKKCYTGIICGIPRPPNNLYIDDARRLKMLPKDIIDEIIALIEKYEGHVRVVGIEDNAFQKTYNFSLEARLREIMYQNPNFHNVTVRGLPWIDKKHRRIHCLETFFRAHQIYIREGSGITITNPRSRMNGLEQLLYQVYHYPNLGDTNLDMIDALAYQPLVIPPILLHNPHGIIGSTDSTLKGREIPKYNSLTCDFEGPSRIQERGLIW